MNSLHKLYFFWLILLFSSVKGQEQEFIHLKKYSQEDGLSSYNVRKIFEDSYGFIWVATQDGLNKFDGRSFVQYKKNAVAKHRLSGIDIREMVEDPATKTLWILTAENSVNVIDLVTGNVIKSIAFKQENPNEWSLSMLVSGDRLIIGSLLGVKVYNKNDGNLIAKLGPLPLKNLFSDGSEARCIATDINKNIWVTYGGYGVIVYDSLFRNIANIPLDKLNLGQNKKKVRFNDACLTIKNVVFLATDYGLRKISYDDKYHFTIDNEPCKTNATINTEPVESVNADEPSTIYLSAEKNLYKYDNSLFHGVILNEVRQGAEGSWQNDVLKIYPDQQHNIWLGCQQGLAFISKYKDPFYAVYSDAATNEKLDHVMSIDRVGADTLLVGLRNGLAIVNQHNFQFSIIEKGSKFHHVFQDPFKKIHVSTRDGMFIFQHNALVPLSIVYPEFIPYQSSFANSHVLINDSIIVMGMEDNTGILVWNINKHSIRSINEFSQDIKLPSGIVNSIYDDRSGNVWVLSDNTITIIDKTFSKTRVIDKTVFIGGEGLFFDMCEANGYFWIASYGTGLIQLDHSFNIIKIFSTANGLNNDGVYQIFHVKDRLLITTNNGLSVFDLSNYTFQQFYKNDGLHSNEFEEAAGTIKNGIIYAGGVNGFTIINPDLLNVNGLAPQLYINKIVLETSSGTIDTSNFNLYKFKIPENTLQNNIYFSALNYNNPSRVSYAYRIMEQSHEWINLKTQNFVTLISVSPGTYHFQVRAANEDGLLSSPRELVLVYLPKWYQTWQFKVLIFLMIASIIYGIYRARIYQIKKQHEIRKNIATDLHDDLGSTLNTVKLFTNLAISGVKQKESLEQLKSTLNEATMGLRDMIWVLDDSLDTVDEFVTRLKHYALPVAIASDIETIITSNSEINNKPLTKEEKRNLFLICKEAINNTIKYAKASVILVTIIPEGKKIQITVSDNGLGFNSAEVNKGYGLKNMQYRASQIKYEVSIKSSPGKGTQINIHPR